MSTPGGGDGQGAGSFAVRGVTVIMGLVMGLSFLFGFGNSWALGLHLGVSPYIAPLVAPAVDLSVVGSPRDPSPGAPWWEHPPDAAGVAAARLRRLRHAGAERRRTAHRAELQPGSLRRRWSASPDRLG
ncbi:hypothetical protein FMEAI12_4250005 [Parafrankia sp. Ea1.12]|nr:hypothetical protein FMEAI12_4250005 [Parafrankia sp. Ea1.12]